MKPEAKSKRSRMLNEIRFTYGSSDRIDERGLARSKVDYEPSVQRQVAAWLSSFLRWPTLIRS
jgi:hypothetical protein